MSCGFATLELDLHHPLQKEVRHSLGVLGGNIGHAVAIKDSEVLARRTGFKALTQLFAGPVKSQLSLKLSPVALKEERQVNYARFIPTNLIVAASNLEVVKLFLEVLAAFVLPPRLQPLQVGRTSQLCVSTFLRCVDVPDLLQVLAELWTDTRKGLKRAALREHDQGALVHGGVGPTADAAVDTTSAFMLRQYKRCVMRLYPALSLAPGVLPPLIVGVSDLKRLSMLRALVHVADPLALLTADGMLRATGGGSGVGGAMAGTPTGAGGVSGPVGGTTGMTRAPMSLARANSVSDVRADVAAASAAASASLAAQMSPGGFGSSHVGGGGGVGGGNPWRAGGGVGAGEALRDDGTPDPYAGTVELRHIYAPFHTDEVSYDPNEHSGQEKQNTNKKTTNHQRRQLCRHLGWLDSCTGTHALRSLFA